MADCIAPSLYLECLFRTLARRLHPICLVGGCRIMISNTSPLAHILHAPATGRVHRHASIIPEGKRKGSPDLLLPMSELPTPDAGGWTLDGTPERQGFRIDMACLVMPDARLRPSAIQAPQERPSRWANLISFRSILLRRVPIR